jgi:choloylglycine hydrolase
VVIEYVKGKLSIYPMPTETITNAPSYDWHLLNVRNYIGLRALNAPSVQINGDELSQFGQGSGALGLPGDFTPPSRMIRAAFFNQVVVQAEDAQGNVNRAFKILNQFDIPKGAVREKQQDGNEILEETQWTCASDLQNLKYYFHTAMNRTIRCVDLRELIRGVTKPKSNKIDTPETILDLSKTF